MSWGFLRRGVFLCVFCKWKSQSQKGMGFGVFIHLSLHVKCPSGSCLRAPLFSPHRGDCALSKDQILCAGSGRHFQIGLSHVCERPAPETPLVFCWHLSLGVEWAVGSWVLSELWRNKPQLMTPNKLFLALGGIFSTKLLLWVQGIPFHLSTITVNGHSVK